MRFARIIACLPAPIIVVLMSAQPQVPEARFEASTTLVQVDAVVRANGRPVPDLTAADFQIYEDGKPQRIAAATLQPNRTTAFLVDACSYWNVEREDGVLVGVTHHDGHPPAWGVPYLRTERAVAGFLDSFLVSGIRPGGSPEDRFAILADHEGSGRAGEPGNDLDRVRAGLAGVLLPGRLQQGCVQHTDAEKSILNALNSRLFLEGDLWRITDGRGWVVWQAVSQTIDALADIPGHKDLLIFSIIGAPREGSLVQDLATRANRLGISFSILQLMPDVHTPSAPESRDDLRNTNPVLNAKNWDAYRRSLSEDALLSRLATDTGGVYSRLPDPYAGKTDHYINVVTEQRTPYNYFGVLRRYEQDFVDSALASSVYQISYKPSAASGGYHKIELKILRPGVTARWRAGYFDTPAEEPRIALPAAEELARALERPLRGTAIRLRAMPFDRADEGPKGLRPIIDLVLSMDARDLTWTRQTDGTRKARIDATAAWYKHDLRPEGTVTHSCEPTQAAGRADTIVQCALEIDPDDSGFYFVRAAVRDAGSGVLGTAYTMAPAPGYNSGHMMFSAPVIRGASGGDALSVDPVLAPGEVVDWQMTAYGAQPDKKTNSPNMTLRISIGNEVTFKPVSIGQEEALNTTGPAWRVPLKGKFQLPTDLVPGDYIVEFLVTDKLGKDKIREVGGVQQNSRVAEFHIAASNSTGTRN